MEFATLFNELNQQLHSDIIPQVISIVANSAPLWLPIILWKIFWPLWVDYVRAEYFLSEAYTLLEIKLPKETLKSPLAMELFLTSLHQTSGEGNLYDKFWLGKTRPWFSLEIVSIEGDVHFFIWMRKSWKNFIESSLYAQFPGIEIYDREHSDYARALHFDGKTMAAWPCELELTKPDPYPIKTYVDYGLDKDPKEEFKVDPLAPLIEFLGSMGANQQIWIQIIVRAHKSERLKAGHFFKYEDSWKEDAKKEINTILVRDAKTKVAGTENEQGFLVSPTITKGEQDVVAALERSLTKQAFDVGIRGIYIANKKEFFSKSNISGLTGSFKQFSSEHLNGFKPNGSVWGPSFSFPWQDFRDYRKNRMISRFLAAYRRRAFFFPPEVGKAMVLNTEELATIFHFPGQVAAAPTLTRIGSKKSEAPSNLPI
ncbi:MAG: hypothetical protein HZA80_02710 [Candidatus Taylorbacteria bacterium]|nr:hypothetical protein [Candidatus Taylorbacteria bacterium]